MLDELEAWKSLEELYRKVGVSRFASPIKEGKVCILTGLAAVLDIEKRWAEKRWADPTMGLMIARLQNNLDGGSVGRYNDTHTREENLALIAQCRSECAAEIAKMESIEVTV